jgi:RNA polymerase sigma factor for flagellar operon FliA
MVEKIARNATITMGMARHLDDAIAYGRKGALDAARRFDPENGASFRAFATPRIHGAVVDGLRQMVAVPRRAYERLSAPKADGRDRLLLASMATAQADGLLPKPAFDTQGEHMAASAGTTGEETSLGKAVLGILERGIETLPPDEAKLVHGHYLEDKTFDQLAKEAGLSPAWVSRLHARALKRLAKLLAVDFKSRT